MLFLETIKKYEIEVETAVNELFTAVQNNQTHEQDLLLVDINGFYQPVSIGHSKYSPFMFGPQGWEYYTDRAQYDFFDNYRRLIFESPKKEFFTNFHNDKEKQSLFSFTTQIELMIFLKFWESNRTIKKLYQLTNLAKGNNYNWHFEISKDDSMHEIIRLKIRDPLKTICPNFYKLIKDIYLSQIRNATAHSDFYIIDDTIGFNNYNPKNHAPLTQIKFAEWENRIVKLILLFNKLIKHFNDARRGYIGQQIDKEFGLQIRMTESDGTETYRFIKYHEIPGRQDWITYEQWKAQYK